MTLHKSLFAGILLTFLSMNPIAAQGADLSLRLRVEATVDDGGASVTVTFSRPADYRFEESRGRLRLILAEAIDSADPGERTLESEVLRRFRVDLRRKDGEITFFLGRQFETFTSEEFSDPFRVVLQFLKAGIPPAANPPEQEGSSTAAGAGTAPESAPAPSGRVIVIDPGHGGNEEGALGPGGLKEKDLVLDIALRLGQRLRSAGFEPVLTRRDDKALDLPSRTAEANRARAGLFISIHANASVRAKAHGAETYFLSAGVGSDPESESLAGIENTGAPDSEIQMVLWEMAQVEHLSASSRLAEMIQAEMNMLGDTRDRGVKQAPFRVLVGATMPAVLVEVGFLSNPDEEARLATDDYRSRIAGALAAAIVRFAGPAPEGAGR